VQLVIQDLVSEEKEKGKFIKSLVRSWYLLLCSTDTLAQQRDFSNALIKFLSEKTYDQSASRRAAQAEAALLSQNLTVAMEVEKQLSLVINTLKVNADSVAEAMLEGMRSVSQPIRSSLPPFHLKQRDLDVIRYDLEHDRKYGNKSKKTGETKNKGNESKSGHSVSKEVQSIMDKYGL
jgi:hypothetical protein